MKHFTITATATIKNEGIRREWAYCSYYKVTRTAHDRSSYSEDSDLNIGDRHISIKASAFTLMSGNLCEGRDTFDGIWNLYESKVHSNEFAYITKEYEVYEMNLATFKKFVYQFCHLEKESAKNGGQVKIRCRKESQKMLDWLNNMAS